MIEIPKPAGYRDPHPHFDWICWALLITAGVLLLILVRCTDAGAQETHREMVQRHGQDPYMAWDYRVPGKSQTSCCNGRDCRPVKSRWNSEIMNFELEPAPGVWVPVDRDKVVSQPSFDEDWHWCAPRARPLSPWCLIEPASGV